MDRGGKQTHRGSVTRVIIRAISFVRVRRSADWTRDISSRRSTVLAYRHRDNYARAERTMPSRWYRCLRRVQKLRSRRIPPGWKLILGIDQRRGAATNWQGRPPRRRRSSGHIVGIVHCQLRSRSMEFMHKYACWLATLLPILLD